MRQWATHGYKYLEAETRRNHTLHNNKRRRRRGGSCKSLRIASCQISPTVTFSIICSCTHHKNPQIFYYDMVLLFTRVKWEETEKNQRNPFQWEVNSSVHPNKSHFMRISWKLQQLNADTGEEIYHQWLLFWFLLVPQQKPVWYWGPACYWQLLIRKRKRGGKSESRQLDFFIWMSEQLSKNCQIVNLQI